MAWKVQKEIPSGRAICENRCSDASGREAVAPGRYLKTLNSSRLKISPAHNTPAEALRCMRRPSRKLTTVEASSTSRNQVPQVR